MTNIISDMNDIITIPQPIFKMQKTCQEQLTTILNLKYIGNIGKQIPSSSTTITITNPSCFTLEPFQFKKICFPIMVLSSLPASSFVYAPELLYRLGLHCIISVIPTNDTFLYITVYNYTTQSVKCQNLQFYCTTTLSNNKLVNIPLL